jgi:hypothetical protein
LLLIDSNLYFPFAISVIERFVGDAFMKGVVLGLPDSVGFVAAVFADGFVAVLIARAAVIGGYVLVDAAGFAGLAIRL